MVEKNHDSKNVLKNDKIESFHLLTEYITQGIFNNKNSNRNKYKISSRFKRLLYIYKERRK
jgi:hypothetical protein